MPGVAFRTQGAESKTPPLRQLKRDFANPPNSARPRVYWFWLGGSITREGITADLEAMKEAGIGGTLIMNAYPSTPPVKLDCMSPEWWSLFEFAAHESARLGLEMGTHNCPGWSTSGGPWITPDLSMQKVVWSEYRTNGPGPIIATLPRPDVDPRWKYYQDIKVLAVRGGTNDMVAADTILDLSSRMTPAGVLTWDVPEGDWTIFRFGHTTTGHMNGPAPTAGEGLESDKMRLDAAKLHFNSYAKKLIDRMGSLAGKTFSYFEIDSYEAGSQNWTPGFNEDFRQRRGYDPLPWLPVLAGRIIGNPEQTQRFKWDMDRTIAELFAERHYRPLAEMVRAHGLRMDNEPYGGPFDSLTVAGTADMPMGECWTSDWGWNTLQPVVAAAHTYGKRLAGAEALTAQPIHGKWMQDPLALKPYADKAFCVGINMLVLHCYALQPWTNVTPGMTMNFWGTHFSRTQTWWPYSGPWFDYLARCQYLLQSGQPASDLCQLGGGYDLIDGYKADACSEEILLTKMSVRDGKLVLPHGVSYSALLLPNTPSMDLPVIEAIARLTEAGATIIGSKPIRTPGLKNFPKADEELQRTANKLWGSCDGKTIFENRHGKGRVISGKSARQVLREMGVPPDFECDTPEQGILDIHRKLDNGIDLYFVSNQENRWRDINALFRVANKTPALWHPDTGRTEEAITFTERGGRMMVPLRLPPVGSVFVVFRPGSSSPKAQPVNRAIWTHTLSGPWDVAFQKNLGAPDRITLTNLVSWTSHSDLGVRHFSGTATYKSRFVMPKADLRRGRTVILDLGNVKNIAELALNGKSVGIAWKPPFELDITRALKPGENTLEIKVANLWPNRMIGDEYEPDDCQWSDEVTWEHSKPAQKVGRALVSIPQWVIESKPRPASGRFTFSTWKFFTKDSPLIDSGLLGPVTVRSEAKHH